MWKGALACFAAGSVAGAVAFVDNTRVTIAEVLFVIFFLAGMAMLASGGFRYGGGRAPGERKTFRRQVTRLPAADTD